MPGENWPEFEYEIIGVLPPDFRVPPVRRRNSGGYGLPEPPPAGQRVWTETDVILPVGLDFGRGRRFQRIAESEPRLEGLEVTVVPVGEMLSEEYGLALGFLWAATALVLLVACASVSSLLLGWGVVREQELAVRAALGAGARRIEGPR